METLLGNGDRPRLSLTPWSTQELVKHTQDVSEKENLRLALDAMRVRGWAGAAGWAPVLVATSLPPEGLILSPGP